MNKPSDFFDLDTLDRYMAGEASREERARAELWLGGRADRRALVNVLGSVAAAGRVVEPEYDQSGDWARLKGQLASQPATKVSRFRSRYIPLGIAAALLVLAAPKVATIISSRLGSPIFMAAQEYATQRGQRVNVTLADGSKVILGPATRLKVKGRTAELQGEAFFDVAPNSRAPFTVLAAGITTTVLGTRFGVRAYGAESQVAVESGRVSVVGAKGGEVLGAGDIITVQGAKAFVARGQDLTQYLDWANGRLVFSNTLMQTVVEELSRWYDVDIQLGSPELARSHFTASFKDEPLEFVLNSLNVTLGARYERTGNRVTLLKSSN